MILFITNDLSDKSERKWRLNAKTMTSGPPYNGIEKTT